MAEQALKAGLVSYEVSPALDSYIHDSGESRKSELSRGRSTNPVPREDATLSWQNINVSVMEGKGRSVWQRIVCKSTPAPNGNIKHILNDVNGTVKPGSLLAIMGASGAGKSTLMNVLAHRNIADMQVSGTVMVNERKVGLDINTISAYVQQEDLFIGKLTVREHLVQHR
ncbi:predicted protein [Nematostella vectensis]|uniref:ABC transporter domain-containing protein n=1 Tax=Nematostella vectensis TaxID=45351 RepID=A7RQX3_NEMVE|nr:predicted protein [Nematostella vectensis]|eukprot:XP_001638240.1 predicted protein [Nematostella vectensis]